MRPPSDKRVPWGTEHYWTMIKSFEGEFTSRDLFGLTSGVRVETVRIALRAMVRLGLVEVVRERPSVKGMMPARVYICARPAANITAVMDAARTGLKGRRQQQMWVAMRTLSQWTIAELSLAASTDEVEVSSSLARTYVIRLQKAGIVMVLRPKRSAGHLRGTLPALYRLKPSANSGPKAPEVQRGRGVFDRNRKKWVTVYQTAEVSA